MGKRIGRQDNPDGGVVVAWRRRDIGNCPIYTTATTNGERERDRELQGWVLKP